MTNAVLNVMEDGIRLPFMQLRDPIKAIRDVAQDLSGTVLLERVGGQSVSALEIQSALFDVVKNHYEKAGWMAQIDPLMRYVFDLWERTLTAFAHNDFSGVHTEIEWIAKYELITRYRHRFHVPLSDDRISRLELSWHDITSAGLREKLERSGMLKSVIDQEVIAHAVSHAPRTTRAHIRSKFISAAKRHHRDYSADWGLVRLFNEGNGATVGLQDPFSTSNDEIDALVDSMENNE